MPKILFIATVDVHFRAFHLPIMQWFQERGWEVHVAANSDNRFRVSRVQGFKGSKEQETTIKQPETSETSATLKRLETNETVPPTTPHSLSITHDSLPYCNHQHHIPFARSPFAFSNLRAYRQLKQIIDSNDYALIHCHTPVGGLLGRLAARSARQRGTKVFYTAHGFHFCKGAPLLNWLLFYPVERFLARFTDCLVTITDDDYRLATTHHFPASEIVHVPGVGVDTERFAPLDGGAVGQSDGQAAQPPSHDRQEGDCSPACQQVVVSDSPPPATLKPCNPETIETYSAERQRQRAELGITPDDILLIYAAEFNKNKNQQLLIRAVAEAAKTTPNLHLLLAGNGPLLPKCRQLVKDNGGLIHELHECTQIKTPDKESPSTPTHPTAPIRENSCNSWTTHFLGYRNDLDRLLPLCDIAVASSRREGLPVNVMEAMACGLPVVATANRGHSELVVHELHELTRIEANKEESLSVPNPTSLPIRETSCNSWTPPVPPGFIIPPADYHAMAGRLHQLAVNPVLRHTLGAAGRQRVMEHYALPVVKKKLIDLYERLRPAAKKMYD